MSYSVSATLRRAFVLLATASGATACAGESVVGGPVDGGAIIDAGTADGALDVLDVPPIDAADVPTDTFVPCRSDGDCAGDPGGPVCDAVRGRCVACLVTADHCPAAQHCEALTSTCAAGCRSDEGCTSVADAGVDGGAAPSHVCDTTAHRCVECLIDDDCPSGTLCRGQTCVPGCSDRRTCPGSAACCTGACLDTQTNVDACGGCGVRCALAHAAASCVAGACAVASCASPFADCNATASDGCETDLTTTTSSCGACGRACAPTNATGACVAGACTVASCVAGFADCDAAPANGCEVDTTTDVANCGACGHACAFPGGAAACVAGACRLTVCLAGRGDCDGDPSNGCETDVTTALAHCGACGQACAPAHGGGACVAGACTVATCATGFADCDAMAANGCEVDLTRDVAHCGACASACALAHATAACTASACAVASCAAGFGDCDGAAATGCETDLRTTATSCGACGHACSFANAAALCTAGACALGACATGFADCDGDPANGCEVDTRTAADHCGTCSTVCTTGACAGGVCDRGGNGADGPLTVSASTTLAPAATALTADAAAGATTLRVTSTTGFAARDEVLVIDMQGSDAGHYEYARVASVAAGAITVATGVGAAFRGASDRVQVLRVQRYTSLTVASGATLSVPAWNGTTGGVLAVRVSGTATLSGDVGAAGAGFRGGAGDPGGRVCGAGAQGESPTAVGGRATAANGGGGGGGAGGVACCIGTGQSPGGGGGAYGTPGAAGTGVSGAGAAGASYGDAALVRIFAGSGGGGGGGNCDVPSGGGGARGGVVMLSATTLAITGNVVASGVQGRVGGSYEGAGAGGAGGALLLAGRTVTLTAGHAVAAGGASNTSGSGTGGAGGAGRVRIECGTLNGAACPGASGAVASPAASVGAW